MATLEERITRLENIEAIRYLQAKYQRCLDTRDFDGLAECFDDEVTSSYGNGDMSYNGKDSVMKFLCSVMTLDMPSSHLIHGGEIDVIDEKNAVAKWYLEDYLLHQKYMMKLHGAAIYDVSYCKKDGVWLIKSIGYKRCYEYFECRGLINILTLRKKSFFDDLKKKKSEDLGFYGRYFKQCFSKKK
ncbi:MAG: nuclear transport factor 2 family protein [Candidatus Limimorpha sp.]